MSAEESTQLTAQRQKSVTSLEAANSAAPGAQRSMQCEVVCSCDGQDLWRDCLSSPAVQMAGSRHFAAVALADGTLQAGSPNKLPARMYVGDNSAPNVLSAWFQERQIFM